jgi:hypothetical protein
MNSYAAHTFTTAYLEPNDFRHLPLPEADALAELGDDLALLPAAIADAETVAQAAIDDYTATLFGSRSMIELAQQIAAAAAAGQPTVDLEAELAALHRAGPARLAHAVAATAVAKHTRAAARAEVAAALEDGIGELGTVRAVLAQQIHDHAVAADAAGDSRDGLEHRMQLSEADQRWGRIAGLMHHHAGYGYQAFRNCPSAALDWEPQGPSVIKNPRGNLIQRMIGAKP